MSENLTAKRMILGYPRHRRNQARHVGNEPVFQDKNEGEIQKASNEEAESQDFKRNLDEGRKEM